MTSLALPTNTLSMVREMEYASDRIGTLKQKLKVANLQVQYQLGATTDALSRTQLHQKLARIFQEAQKELETLTEKAERFNVIEIPNHELYIHKLRELVQKTLLRDATDSFNTFQRALEAQSVPLTLPKTATRIELYERQLHTGPQKKD